MRSFRLILFFSCVIYLDALKFENPKSDILPTKEACGLQQSGTTGEFPWVVYLPLEYRTYNPEADLRCAGALISKRYVATGKFCLQFVLTKVHVGQYDTSKNDTCNNSDCVPVEKIDIEEKVVDPNLDVVLLRLAKDVEFTNNIQPICLPFDELKRAEVGDTVYSSGWGLKSFKGGNSPTKKQVKETVVESEDCQKAEPEDFICVKVQDDSGNRACSGDEGSPIMYSSGGQWVLEGVMNWLYNGVGEPCAINRPAGGPKITEEVLQWIVDKIHA